MQCQFIYLIEKKLPQGNGRKAETLSCSDIEENQWFSTARVKRLLRIWQS